MVNSMHRTVTENQIKVFVLGQAIKRIRIAKGWTQARLAGLWGMSVNFVSQVENGRRGVSQKNVEALARILDVPISFLYVLADDPARKPIGVLQELVADFLARDDAGIRGKGRTAERKTARLPPAATTPSR